ncbi:membrane protein [Paenibacillus massiliensis]|uniref:membrane protein n=1 Tax=Paenibacillus massiliensis TaxID=225917 RepID=UPI0004188C07|nr:membrane protein [Paenibacillus massiliensis]
MVVWLIIACEILFWVFVVAGLVARYIFRQKRLGALLLLVTPLIDLILLVAIFVNLRNGGEITLASALAACYIGITVAFGHRLIHWADTRFSYWFAGGPKPVPKYGKEHAREERKSWYLHLLGYLIGNGIMLIMITYVGDPSQTTSLNEVMSIWSTVLVIDFFICFSYTWFPRKNKG